MSTRTETAVFCDAKGCDAKMIVIGTGVASAHYELQKLGWNFRLPDHAICPTCYAKGHRPGVRT